MHGKGIHEKSVITGVSNIDIPGYQDCPPTDCSPRGNLEVENIEIHIHRGKDVLCGKAVFICNLLQGPNIYIS